MSRRFVFPDPGTAIAVVGAAHAADLGMSFYRGNSFPEQYRGGIFWAQHGSWNRTTPVGARVMFTALDENGDAVGAQVPGDQQRGNSQQ